MDGQDGQDSQPARILIILSIHVKSSGFWMTFFEDH